MQVVFDNIVGDVVSINLYFCHVEIVISIHRDSEVTPDTVVFVKNGLDNVTIADSSSQVAAVNDVHIFV